MATFTYPTPTGKYEGGLPATGREVRNDLDEVRDFIISKNLEGSNIQDDTVALANLTPTVREFLAPTGAIMMHSVEVEPAGWLICDGRTVLILSYPDLYAVIGTTFGPDTGTTFTLPGVRGRSPIGTNNANLPDGADGARDSYDPGDTNGDENSSLVEANLTAHTHGIGSHTHHLFSSNISNPGTDLPSDPDKAVTYQGINQTPADHGYVLKRETGATLATLGLSSTSSGDSDSTGSGTEFDVRNPTIAFPFIIKT